MSIHSCTYYTAVCINNHNCIQITMEKRTVLWYMTFWGFAINYVVRMNINIAIVSMVKQTKSHLNATVASECPLEALLLKPATITFENNSLVDRQDDNKFDWDDFQRSAILGAFFTLHIFTQIPGGVLAQRYGTKAVFGLSNGLAALMSFAIPASAKISFKTLVAVRLLQGFIAGAAWPSMHTMTANWIPVHERSRFVSAYFGSSIGTAATYIMCGYLIANFGWESVFYVSGALGLLWLICWTLLVYDTPANHPTISSRERVYIESHVGKTVHSRSKPLPIPWKSILLSKPLYINLLTQTGGIWGLFTLATQAPSYFNFILGLNITQTGLWSGMPHVFRWVFAYGFSMVCDHLVKAKMLSVTNVRKLATSFGNVLQGIFILAISFAGCNSTVAVIMLICATAVNGAVSSGALAAVVDISPNYAGVVQGIIGTVGVSPGFISPLVVGFITSNQNTLSRWSNVFYLSGAICIVTGLIFIIFGSSKVQKWNVYEVQMSNDNEMKLISKKSKSVNNTLKH